MLLPKPTSTITDLDEGYWTAMDPRDPAHRAFRERQLVGRTYEVFGLRLTCPAGIYQPDESSSTRFMLRELLGSVERYGPRALDMGTGSGALALALARAGKEVIATDIDPEAVACARANAAQNGVSIDVRCSDLFGAVAGERFDLIVFNAPLLHGDIEHPVDRVACDPGGALTMRFLMESKGHLTPSGAVVLLASSAGQREVFVEGLKGFEHRVVAAEYFESVGTTRWLLRAEPR